MLKDMSSGLENTFVFWKNMFFMVIFFTIAPLTLGVSMFAILSFETDKTLEVTEPAKTGIRVYASLPSEFPKVSDEIEATDARPEIVRQYLKRYNSPMVHLAGYLVEKADEYGMDYRLLPAIAQQESNLCKIIPPDTYNCWGWGIHSRGTLGFDSYEEAIDTVMTGLKKEYIDKGLTTPDTIWKKYTPGSPDGAWAKGVNQFMADMQ
jgi:hypothetical protein